MLATKTLTSLANAAQWLGLLADQGVIADKATRLSSSSLVLKEKCLRHARASSLATEDMLSQEIHKLLDDILSTITELEQLHIDGEANADWRLIIAWHNVKDTYQAMVYTVAAHHDLRPIMISVPAQPHLTCA